jgi:hypothetical protein
METKSKTRFLLAEEILETCKKTEREQPYFSTVKGTLSDLLGMKIWFAFGVKDLEIHASNNGKHYYIPAFRRLKPETIIEKLLTFKKSTL